MILHLAWKNIWRNPVRSLVVIAAVVVGVWAGVSISAFSNGMTMHYLNSQLDTYVGHVSLQTKTFNEERSAEFSLENVDSLVEFYSNDSTVKSLTPITLADGMIASANYTSGIQIRGIDTATDTLVFKTYQYITKGKYLSDSFKNQIVVGEKLAEKLKSGLRSKVVLTFQRVDGTITSAAFRISGILKTPNSTLDQMRIFVNREDLQKYIGGENTTHELSFRLFDANYAKTFTANHSPLLAKSDTLLNWFQIAPELAYVDSSLDLTLYIFMGIIVLALTLGILNTMLMAILERKRELGMLMAIGTSRPFLFKLIMSETLILSCIGAPLGLFIAYLTVYFTSTYGINLSGFTEGLAMYGMGNVIYPDLKIDYIIGITSFIFIAAVLAAIYPAVKAIKLKPLEAIRQH